MTRRAASLAALVALAVLGVTLLTAPEEDRPVAVVGHAGARDTPSTTTPPVTTTVRAESPPITRPSVATERSSTVVRYDTGGVTVVNEGSAVASTGGNTVIGPSDASVSNGPVSAVGNWSEVRVSPR